MPQAIAHDTGDHVARQHGTEGVTALELATDRPDQARAPARQLPRSGPEPCYQRRAVAWNRVHVAGVGQPPDRAKPDAQRARGGVAVSKRGAHVADARAGIDRDKVNAGYLGLPVDAQQERPLPRMLDRRAHV